MDFKQVYAVMAEQYHDPQKLVKWMIGIVIGTIAVLGWFSTNFVTTAKGEEMMGKAQAEDRKLSEQITELAVEVKASNELLMIHMDKGRLDGIMTAIRTNETQAYNNSQFVSVNGENERTRARARQLKAEHEDLELRKSCIINNNPLCD